jgi:DNA replication protein DnaC
LLENWDELAAAPWLPELLECEERERGRRSLERRLRNSKLGRFKPMADFDWAWPEAIDKDLVDELLELGFVSEAANVVLVGPNGVGKTMIAQNLAHQAILGGYTARFTTASELLNDLAAQDSSRALTQRLRFYSHPDILAIDEVGYLATSSEHADLLFEVITRRYQEKSVILTTNKAFRDWNEVFPSSTCVVTLIDRLMHKAEIVAIKGKSYRLKEAQEREQRRLEKQKAKRGRK